MPISKKSTPAPKKVTLPEAELEQREHLVNAIESLGLQEFIEYIRSPWKLLWPNFVAGVARGFGALVGASIVIALIGWTLSTLIDIPLIGKKIEPYIQSAQEQFRSYTEATNYRPYFEKMEASLRQIEANTGTGSK